MAIASWQDFGVNIPDNEPLSMLIPNWKDTTMNASSKELTTLTIRNWQDFEVNIPDKGVQVYVYPKMERCCVERTR